MRSFTTVRICYDYFFFYNGTCDIWVQANAKQKNLVYNL